MGDEVEPDAADAGLVELGEIGVGERVVDHRHPGEPTLTPDDRVDHRRVVGAVAARLDEHRPRQAKTILQALEVVTSGVRRGVGPVGCEREPASPARRCGSGRRTRSAEE